MSDVEPVEDEDLENDDLEDDDDESESDEVDDNESDDESESESDEDDGDDDDEDDEDEDDESGDDSSSGQGRLAAGVLDYLVRQLVDAPDLVRIDVDDRRRTLRLDVRVGPGDMGRVIGRRGRTANAIRTVVRAAASKDEVEVDVEFVE